MLFNTTGIAKKALRVFLTLFILTVILFSYLSYLSTKQELIKMEKNGKKYFLSDTGVLIGVDFSKNTIVVFTPVEIEKDIVWHCSVFPSEAVPKLCTSL